MTTPRIYSSGGFQTAAGRVGGPVAAEGAGRGMLVGYSKVARSTTTELTRSGLRVAERIPFPCIVLVC